MRGLTTMKILKIYDIAPDGVAIEIDWDKMGAGTSLFVPCIDTEKAIKQVKHICKAKKWRCEHRICVEDAKLGVRFWRTL